MNPAEVFLELSAYPGKVFAPECADSRLNLGPSWIDGNDIHEFPSDPAQAISHLNNFKPVALFIEHGKRSRLAIQPTKSSGIYHAQ